MSFKLSGRTRGERVIGNMREDSVEEFVVVHGGIAQLLRKIMSIEETMGWE